MQAALTYKEAKGILVIFKKEAGLTQWEEIREWLKTYVTGNSEVATDAILQFLDSQDVRIVKVVPGVYPLIESLIEEIKMPNQEQLREKVADIIARGRKDECISLDIAERIIVYLQGEIGESSPPTFRDGSTLAEIEEGV